MVAAAGKSFRVNVRRECKFESCSSHKEGPAIRETLKYKSNDVI